MRVLNKMETGDYLMLLESTDFTYCGQVIHRVTNMCPELSTHIWGEQRFPITIFLQGELIEYGWDQFVADFNFASNYHMRGNTANVGPERMAESKFVDENAFIAKLLTTKGTNPLDQEIDFRVFTEGLEMHLRLVKQRERDHKFRDKLFTTYDSKCAFCDLDIVVALEAAHVVPRHKNGTDDSRNGLILCAVHHRIFDANAVGIEPHDLTIVPIEQETLNRFRITRSSIKHLKAQPHVKALEQRWAQFKKEGTA